MPFSAEREEEEEEPPNETQWPRGLGPLKGRVKAPKGARRSARGASALAGPRRERA